MPPGSSPALPAGSDEAASDTATARAEIDAEVARSIADAHEAATRLLEPRRNTLARLAAALLEHKQIDRAAFVRVMGRDAATTSAYRAFPLQAADCGAEFATRGFSDAFRTELLHQHSRVWITMAQLPAVNTPQCSWCRTRLPDHPRPVAPVYQPEVVAEAIHWAAHHRRREVIVGASAVRAIFGNVLAPGFADRYLARMVYDAQQMPGVPVGDPPDNLFAPVVHEAATHGISDSEARTSSVQVWCTTYRRQLASVAADVIVATARMRRRGSRSAE